MSDDDPIHGEEPALPESLRAELSRLYRVDASVSPAIDRTILNRARAHLARRGRLRLLGEVGAVAAVILLVVGIVITIFSRTEHGNRPGGLAAQQPADVNGDGIVDIRDALLLARKLDAGPVGGQQQDVNRDGVTDRRDVDAIANLAVKLEPGVAR
jgi:hypothetical protein